MIEVHVIGNNDNSFRLNEEAKAENLANLFSPCSDRLIATKFSPLKFIIFHCGVCHRCWSTWHNLNQIEGNGWLVKCYLALIRRRCAALIGNAFRMELSKRLCKLYVRLLDTRISRANIFNWFGYGFSPIFDEIHSRKCYTSKKRMKLHFISFTALFIELKAVQFYCEELKSYQSNFPRNQDKIDCNLKTNKFLTTAELKQLISFYWYLLLVISSLNCTSYTRRCMRAHISLKCHIIALTFPWCSPMRVRYTLKWASCDRTIYYRLGMSQNQWRSKTCYDAFFSRRNNIISHVNIHIYRYSLYCLLNVYTKILLAEVGVILAFVFARSVACSLSLCKHHQLIQLFRAPNNVGIFLHACIFFQLSG